MTKFNDGEHNERTVCVRLNAYDMRRLHKIMAKAGTDSLSQAVRIAIGAAVALPEAIKQSTAPELLAKLTAEDWAKVLKDAETRTTGGKVDP